MEKRMLTSIFAACLALILSSLFINIHIAGGFLGVQKGEYILDLSNLSFRYILTKFNDSASFISSAEFDFPENGGNKTFYLSIPKNATVQNISMNLTGKLTTIYNSPVKSSNVAPLGISIGNIFHGDENEIVTGTSGYDGEVSILYGSNGTLVKEYYISPNPIYSTDVGNVTSDLGEEIVVGSGDGKVYLLNSTGNEIWNYTTGGSINSVKIGNIVGSEDSEIVACSSTIIYVINRSRNLEWNSSVEETINEIVIGNLTEDEGNEIVAGCAGGKIYILNSAGIIVSNITVGDSSINTIDLGDITSDPGNEIVIGTGDNKVYILNSTGGEIKNYSTGGSVNSLRIGEIANDYAGNEIVIGCDNKELYILNSTGHLIGNFVAGDTIKSIAIGNLTTDEGSEVVAGAIDGKIYVFNFDYFPTNLSIDVGNDSTIDWKSSKTKLRTSEIATGQNLVSAINNYINTCTTLDTANNCQIPLIFHSDFKGKLNISNLSVEYVYNVSGIISYKKDVAAWSRTSDIKINESVGSKVYNITFKGIPAENISIKYIVVDNSATKCDFNLTSYNVTNITEFGIEKRVCNISSNPIILNAGNYANFSILFWDSSQETSTPIHLYNTSDYYSTYGMDNYKRRINLTLNATNGTFKNATAWWQLNDSQIEGEEFLLVDWYGNGTFYDITPPNLTDNCNTSNPTYTQIMVGSDTFYVCKKKINNNMYFKWKQPTLSPNNPTNYLVGGSYNLPPNLTDLKVSPSSDIWGANFTFSANVTDIDNDAINVVLFIFKNKTKTWVNKGSKNVTNGTIVEFNLTSDKNWTGISKFKIEYFDYNSNNTSKFHNPRNTTSVDFNVLKHNVSVVYLADSCEGNNSVVFRNETATLSVFINDTNSEETVIGANCSLWVNKWINSTKSNSSGYCKFSFNPGQTFEPGKTNWHIGIKNDDYYNDKNSTEYNLTIKGWLKPTILNPVNFSFYKNEKAAFSARLVDRYENYANLSSYTCHFYLNESFIGTNTTNSSGICSLIYTPNCSLNVGIKNLSVEINGTHDFYNISDNQTDEQIILRDKLNLTIISPKERNYYKGQNITLNASAKDNCGNDTTEVLINWYLVNKYKLNLTIKDLSGKNRTNYPIILNGSFFSSDDFELKDWNLNKTKILFNETELPFSLYSWKTADKLEINKSQEYMTNLTELVFLVNLSANESKTFEINLKKENLNSYNITYNILNAGFDSGDLSYWNSSICSTVGCHTNISHIGSDYFANLSANGGETKLFQRLPNFTYPTSIKIKYKSWGEFNESSSSGEFYIKVGEVICNLTEEIIKNTDPSGDVPEPENWTIDVCTNLSFASARNISVVIWNEKNTGAGERDAVFALIDYLCFADESGECVNFHSGEPVQIYLSSKKKIGENTTNYILNGTEDVGRRKLVAEAEKQFYDSDKKTLFFNLTGFAYINNLTIVSNYCTFVNVTEDLLNYKCMQNANLSLLCKVADNYTEKGIPKYNVSFYNTTTLIGFNLTDEKGLSVKNSKVGGEGNYNFSCNIADQPNLFYNATELNEKKIKVEVSSGNTTADLILSLNTSTAEGITIENNATLLLNFFLNNTGNGTMYNPLITVSKPIGIFIPAIYCEPIPTGKNCTRQINITVTAGAEIGNNQINFTVEWQNADGTKNNTMENISIYVKENKRIKFSENNLTLTVPITASRTANFTILNYGNVDLTNIILNLTGDNSDLINNWTTFSNNNFGLNKSGNSTINLILTIPDNNSYINTYHLNITATIQNCTGNCTDHLPLILNITSRDWEVSPIYLNKTVGLKKEINKLGEIIITNKKEADFEFNLSILPGNETTINYLTLNDTKQANQTSVSVTSKTKKTVEIFYDTDNNSLIIGTYNYTLKIENLDESATPKSVEIPITFTIINFTVDIISPKKEDPYPEEVSPNQNLTIEVESKEGNVPVQEDINWTILIGGEECIITDLYFHTIRQRWFITCTAPNITDNPIKNNLEVIGNYTKKEVVLSDVEEEAIIYKDYTSPWFSNIHTYFIDNTSYTLPYIIFKVNVTDNKEIDSVWATVNHTGSNWKLDRIYPISNNTLPAENDFDKRNFVFNFSNPKRIGDYDIIVYANDTEGNPVSSKKGWFDIYLPIQMTGNLTNPDGEKINANFTFYREEKNLAELYKMHEFSIRDNKTYNWTLHKRKYDVDVDLFGQKIIFYDANLDLTENEIKNPFKFDYFGTYIEISNKTEVNKPDETHVPILGFVVDTNINLSKARLILDVTDAYNYVVEKYGWAINPQHLRIFKCHNWNYIERKCNSDLTSSDILNATPENKKFNFTVSSLSAFFVAEACYSGSSLVPCTPYSKPEEKKETSGGISGGGGGGGQSYIPSKEEKAICGNNVCEIGENWQNCPNDCPIEKFPLVIDTNIGDVRVFRGELKTYWLSMKNKLYKNVSTTLEITEGLRDLLSLSTNKLTLQPNETKKLDIYLTVFTNQSIGTYAGNIIIRAEGQKQSIPVTIRVLESAAPIYSVKVEIASKTINPKGTLDFIVKLVNLGERKKYPLNLTYIIKYQKTNKIIEELKTNTTLETTTIVRESLPLNITEEGSYTLEVWADYKEKSIMDVATFEVVKPLFESPLTVGLLILALAMAVAVGGTYIWRYYLLWRKEKEKEERYLYPLDYRKVPREGFKIGKFAGTDNYCYYDPKDLTTHIIVAGATGAGKSVSASVFAEEALDKKIPVIVFDPTAQWTGFVKPCRDNNLLSKYKKFDMGDFDIKSYPGLIYDVEEPDFKLNIKEFINPGEITIFCLNKLKSGEYDEAVRNIVASIFRESWEESSELKLVIVFDEVHRLLEKYGGHGGYVALEKAAREFRKWGIGIIMCSQVLADFKEAIAGNVLTELQLNTKSLTDIDKVKTKYGEQYSERIARMGVGAGLMQYPKYNDGKPFFVEFRPTKHNPHKIRDDELVLYKKYIAKLKVIEEKIKKLKERNVYTEDYEVDFKLATNKLKTGNFRMAEIYISSLENSLEKI